MVFITCCDRYPQKGKARKAAAIIVVLPPMAVLVAGVNSPASACKRSFASTVINDILPGRPAANPHILVIKQHIITYGIVIKGTSDCTSIVVLPRVGDEGHRASSLRTTSLLCKARTTATAQRCTDAL